MSEPERYFIGQPRNEREEAIVRVLRSHEPAWRELGVRPEDTQVWTEDRADLVAHLDIVDPSDGGPVCVTLRLDFGDGWVVGGRDPTGQLVGALDPRKAGLHVQGSPEDTAEAGAAWMEGELRRPLERIDWREGGRVVASEWRFADTATGLVFQGARRPGAGTAVLLRPDRRVDHGSGIRDDRS